MPYATITGTRRNLEALRTHGWRLLVTPDTYARSHRPKGFRFALDNGAWGAHQQSRPFPAETFAAMVAELGAAADWVVLPDIVAGGSESLALSLSWLDRLSGLRLLAVQDGMTLDQVRPHLGPTVGLFLGGSTAWKLSTMRSWGRLAAEVGCHYHVARVNTGRRIRLCQDAGADSFDGTSCTRFAVNTPRLTAAVRQGHLFGGLNDPQDPA